MWDSGVGNCGGRYLLPCLLRRCRSDSLERFGRGPADARITVAQDGSQCRRCRRTCSTAVAWRASMHTTGTPARASAWQSQVERKPVSSPTRTTSGARLRTTLASTSGSVAHCRARGGCPPRLNVDARRAERDVEADIRSHGCPPWSKPKHTSADTRVSRHASQQTRERQGCAKALGQPRLRHVSTERQGRSGLGLHVQV